MPLHRRVPKRGFHNPFRVEYEVVNLDTIGLKFDAGTVVTPELLRERGLVPGGDRKVKVLARGEVAAGDQDRKSTRLNSSHLGISYAVFCLKKKRKKQGENNRK